MTDDGWVGYGDAADECRKRVVDGELWLLAFYQGWWALWRPAIGETDRVELNYSGRSPHDAAAEADARIAAEIERPLPAGDVEGLPEWDVEASSVTQWSARVRARSAGDAVRVLGDAIRGGPTLEGLRREYGGISDIRARRVRPPSEGWVESVDGV